MLLRYSNSEMQAYAIMIRGAPELVPGITVASANPIPGAVRNFLTLAKQIEIDHLQWQNDITNNS